MRNTRRDEYTPYWRLCESTGSTVPTQRGKEYILEQLQNGVKASVIGHQTGISVHTIYRIGWGHKVRTIPTVPPLPHLDPNRPDWELEGLSKS